MRKERPKNTSECNNIAPVSSAFKSYTKATTVEKLGTGAKMSANSLEINGRLLWISNVQTQAMQEVWGKNPNKPQIKNTPPTHPKTKPKPCWPEDGA